MSFIPKPHEIYKHFKGNLYQVTAVAEHTETGEQLVVYQALYDNSRVYARPLSMFVERVDREKYPGVEQEFRFELQGPEADRQRAESEPAESAAEESMAEAGAYSYAVKEVQEAEESVVEPAANSDAAEEMLEIPRQKDISAEPEPDARRTPEQAQTPVPVPEAEESEEELYLDPLVIEFLDSDSYEEKLNILAGLHHRITDDMITTMAIASDIEINDGDVEERYEALKACLLTLEKYECNRLR